jgi:DNA repair protein RecO (recombination protein O)
MIGVTAMIGVFVCYDWQVSGQSQRIDLRRSTAMRTYTADALVLRTYRYGEADRIVVFLTEDRGKKRGVAKSATASRRRFGGALESLTRGRVTYVEREGRDLVRVDRIEPQGHPLTAASGRDAETAAQALGHAAYFAELLDEWAPDGLPNERLYRLGSAMADALGQAALVEPLARYFEYWLLRLEGVYPATDVCPRCGRPALGEGAVLVVADRAYVCRGCSAGGTRLSPEAMAFLRRAACSAPVVAAGLGVPARALRDLEQAHERLIVAYLEKDLRSMRVIKELRPES